MTRLRKLAVFCHRWLGTVFCLLFGMWFFSGFVLVYWEYPEVESQDRLARSVPLDPITIRVSPEQAGAALGGNPMPDRVTLEVLDSRPVYRFYVGDSDSIVYADDGRPQDEISQDLAARIASAWARQPIGTAKFAGLLTLPDQWTVSGDFAAVRPLFKYEWPDGEEVYVSQISGQVEQYTTSSSRLGAYFGAIPHWLYFTPLRKNGRLWSRIVIWASGAGTVAALLGLIVGIWIVLPAQRIPYAGQKRWHAILGLLFGLVASTWVFSGMLSMDPFGWESGADTSAPATALRGAQWNAHAFADRSPSEALALATAAGLKTKRLDLTFFNRNPVYLAIESDAHSLAIPVHGEPSPQFDPARIAELFGTNVVETRLVQDYEAYYIDRHHRLPLPALMVRLNDADRTMYYIDLKTGRIVQSYVANSRRNRWLYHGLHSMDLPWLYENRPAWDILVLILLAGGASLSVTSIILGWRFIQRKMLGKAPRLRAGLKSGSYRS